MKTSTVLRRAAEYVAESQDRFGICCCCSAISGLRTYEKIATRQETTDAQALFEEFFKPEGLSKDNTWWGVSTPDDFPRFTENQDARVIALLLAAEIAKEGSR